MLARCKPNLSAAQKTAITNAIQTVAAAQQSNQTELQKVQTALAPLKAIDVTQLKTLAASVQSLQGAIDQLYAGYVTGANGQIALYTGSLSAIEGLRDVATNTSTSSELYQGATQVTGGLSQSVAGVDTLAAQLPHLTTILGQLTTGATSLNSGLTELTTNSAKLNAGATQLTGGMTTMNGQLPTLTSGVTQLATGANQLASGVTQYTTGTSKVATGLNTLNSQVPTLMAGVTQLDNGAQTLNANSATLQSGAGQLATGLTTLNDQVPTLTAGVTQLDNGAQTLNTNSAALGSGADQLTKGLGTLNGQVPTLTAGVQQLAAGASQLDTGLAQENAGMLTLNKKLAAGSQKVSQLNFTSANVDHFVTPIANQTQADNLAKPLLAVLAPLVIFMVLFIGAVLTELGFNRYSHHFQAQPCLQKFALLAAAIILQAAGILVVTSWLGVTIAHPVTMLLLLLLGSGLFTLIVFTFDRWWGTLGVLATLALLFVQLIVSGGLLPNAMLSTVYQGISTILPGTYLLNGLNYALNDLATKPVASTVILVVFIVIFSQLSLNDN